MERPLVPTSQRVFGELVYWITVISAIICILGPLIAFTDMGNNQLNPHYLMQNIFDGMKPDFESQELQEDVSAGQTTLAVKEIKNFDDPEKASRDVEIRIMDTEGNGEIAIIKSVDKDNNILELKDGLLNSYAAEHTEVAEVTLWNSKGNRRLDIHAEAGQDMIRLVSTDRIDDPTAEYTVAIMVRDDNSREVALIESINRETNTIKLTSALQNSYSTADNATISQVTVVDETEGGHFWIENFTKGDGFTQFGMALGCAVGLPAMLGAALLFASKERSYGWALGSIWIALMIGVSAVGLISLH